VLIDPFSSAIEVDVDALSDGEDVVSAESLASGKLASTWRFLMLPAIDIHLLSVP
jgi:hypothetical protein